MTLTIPCPHCPDGFTTHGDRHARTAKDVCRTCGGDSKVPVGTDEPSDAFTAAWIQAGRWPVPIEAEPAGTA